MPEYYGYVPQQTPQVNFRELFGEVGAKIVDAFNVRDNERAAFAQRAAETEQSINEYESSQNPMLESIVQTGMDSMRDQIYEWKQLADRGEMTQAKYKERMNTLDQYWTAFAGAAKSFDQRAMETLKRQQPDENGVIQGSGWELYMNKTYSEIANLKGRSIYVNPDSGRLYLAQRDPEGNILDYTDVRTMNNPGNIIDNRVNLNKTIAANVENFGEWKTYIEKNMGATSVIENVRNNPEFVNAKNALIGSVLSNDRAATSVLVDNGAGRNDKYPSLKYDFYTSEGELRGKLLQSLEVARRLAAQSGQEFDDNEFMQEASKRMILGRKDETGVFQPILTQEQKDAARERVNSEIEIQLGLSESGSPRWKPDYGGGGGSEDGDVNWARYATVEQGWVNADSDLLNSVALEGYDFEVNYGNDNVPRVIVRRYLGRDKKGRPQYERVTTAKNARELARFIYKPGTAGGVMVTPEQQFDQEKRNKIGTVGAYRNDTGILD